MPQMESCQEDVCLSVPMCLAMTFQCVYTHPMHVHDPSMCGKGTKPWSVYVYQCMLATICVCVCVCTPVRTSHNIAMCLLFIPVMICLCVPVHANYGLSMCVHLYMVCVCAPFMSAIVCVSFTGSL